MISVCLSTFNGEQFIAQQLDSILSQLSTLDEIIISDDGSTDRTIDLIQSYRDPRIKLFTHERYNKFRKYPFIKITKNIENAFNHARGDLLFLADQDDIWDADKVLTVTHEIGDNLCLLHDCSLVDEDGRELTASYYAQNKSRAGFFPNLANSSYLGCCMVIRKELLAYALPFPLIPVPHDIWLGLIADWKGKMKMSDKKLLMYRRHDSNQSTAGGKSKAGLFYKIHYRLNILLALLMRMLFKK